MNTEFSHFICLVSDRLDFFGLGILSLYAAQAGLPQDFFIWGRAKEDIEKVKKD